MSLALIVCQSNVMKQETEGAYDQARMSECLFGQAHLCEEIARACADEKRAARFRQLAQECRAAVEGASK
jgi:hypothetical protein